MVAQRRLAQHQHDGMIARRHFQRSLKVDNSIIMFSQAIVVRSMTLNRRGHGDIEDAKLIFTWVS